jgi:16S rRNA processing protein RimM
VDKEARTGGAEPVIVARIARAHGLEGGLVLRLETDYAETVFVPGRKLLVADPPVNCPAELTVVEAAPHGRAWRLIVEELPDRTTAELYRGLFLSVAAAELEELAEDEYFFHDLVGLDVLDADAGPIGRVHEVYESPASVLLAVEVEGKEKLIPFGPETVVQVDLEGGTVTVRLPTGLLEI